MKNLFLLFFILLAAQVHSQSSLQFEFDYARFNYDPETIYMELYYSVAVNSLTKIEKDDSSFVEAILHITMNTIPANERIVDKKFRIYSPYYEDSSDNSLLGVLGFGMPTGEYVLNIELTDIADSLNRSFNSEKIALPAFNSEKASISDLQLASRIITGSRNSSSLFYKNTMEVFPHPIGVFGSNIPMLFFYTELYNLKSDTTSSGFLLNQQVFNSYNIKVYEKTKPVKRTNNSIVEVGAINVSKFPSGSYTLNVNLFGENSLSGVASIKKFYVFNPGVEDTFKVRGGDYNVLSSEFGIFSLEECDAHFARCEYVATSEEIDQYESLEGVEAKREFLFNFWKLRDNIPETPINEVKEEYRERMDHVEARYKTFSKDGYRTDRGRVYLIYGEPDEIELHPNDYDKKPHEIWYYHGIEGGVLFVFGDITGYADYELLHSTKRGELRDDDWVRRVSTL